MMQRLDIQLPQGLATGASGPNRPLTTTPLDQARQRAERYNRTVGTLTGYDCPECLNRGYFFRVDGQGASRMEECRCMAVRRARGRVMRSGLGDMLERYTLSSWQSVQPWQEKARGLVEAYARHPSGWFLAAGGPGTGKTHLCTALCGLLLDRGVDVRYVLWRDMSVRAKALVGDAGAYQQLIAPLKQVPCLCIDDLFKSGRGREPTAGDVNLAFELLNSRYNHSGKLTILSTERTVEELLDIDEALGSRVYERSRRFYLNLSGRANWRLGEGRESG